MPTITSSTTLTLTAGQAYVFLPGSGVGTAIADPDGRNAKFSIGPQQTAVGPFTTAVSVAVTIVSGSISYRVDGDGDMADQAPAIASINERLSGAALSSQIARAVDSIASTAGIALTATAVASRSWFDRTIGGATFYVSKDATNGFVVGNDSNTGLSKAAPKLTLSGAFAAAAAGDTIILNDSATPYDSAFFNVNKSITILPLSYRGATIRSTNTSYTLYLDADYITLGALVIDCTITSGGLSAAAVRSPAAASARKNARLIGPKLIGNTYSAYLTGPVYMSGVEMVSAGASRAWLRLDTALAGDVILEDVMHDGNVTCKPTVAGVNYIQRRCKFKSSASIAQRALDCVGASTYLIEDSEMGVDVSTSATGLLIYPHATIPVTSCIIRRNKIRNGVAAAQQTSGYGIGVGAENTTDGSINGVQIYGNDINHANHGLFVAYQVNSGETYGNVVRDSIIGLINKGIKSDDVYQHHNIVIGGPLTGGALRHKESAAGRMENNLVIYDAQSTSGADFILVTDGSIDPKYRNNILYAPNKTGAVAVDIEAGSAATLERNNYHASSFSATGFDGGDWSAWVAAHPTENNVNPAYPVNDYTPTPSIEALIASPVEAGVLNFWGDAAAQRIGPI